MDVVDLQPGTYYLWVDSAFAGQGTAGTFVLRYIFGSGTPPPGNAACSSATPLSLPTDGGAVVVTGDSTGASDTTESAVCEGSGHDVFYSLQLAADSSLSLTVTPADGGIIGTMAPVVDLRTDCGAPDGGTDELRCSPSTAPQEVGDTVTLVAPDVPAGNYIIVVDGFGGTYGPFSLSVSSGAPIPPPANDTCSGAIALTAGTPVNGDTTFANDDYEPDPSCTGFDISYPGPDVVYSFTPTTTGRYTFTLTPSDLSSTGPDFGLYLSTTCLSAGGFCLDGIDFGSGVATTLSDDLTAGTTYLVFVDSSSTGSLGAFTLEVDAATTAAPPNDTCAGAIALSLNTTVQGDTTNADNDYYSDTGDECTQYSFGGPDLVYSFTPTTSGNYTVTLTPADTSNNGPDLALYMLTTCPTGPVGACLAGSDQGVEGQPETLTSVPLTAGTTYLIFVDSFYPAANPPAAGGLGAFSISVTQG